MVAEGICVYINPPPPPPPGPCSLLLSFKVFPPLPPLASNVKFAVGLAAKERRKIDPPAPPPPAPSGAEPKAPA